MHELSPSADVSMMDSAPREPGGSSFALHRALLAVAGLVALLTVALSASAVVDVYGGRSATLDFSAFYTAGWLVREGLEDSLYDASVQEETQRALSGTDYDRPLPFASPAFAAYLFVPLSALPFRAAYGAMLAANAGLLTACLLLLRSLVEPLAPLARRAFLGTAAVAIPVVAVLTAGQIDLLATAALLGGLVLLRREQTAAAGLVFAVSLAKPQLALGVALLLVVAGPRRTLAAFLGAGAVLAALPILTMGPEAVVGNVQALGRVGEAGLMANWRGFLASTGLPDRLVVWGPGWVLLSAVALAAAARCWRSPAVSWEQRWAVAFLLPLLVSPHLHGQSLVLLLPAAALFLRGWACEGVLRERQAVSLSLALFVLLFVRWAVTLAGLAVGVFLLVPLYLAAAMPWTAAPHAAEHRRARLRSAA